MDVTLYGFSISHPTQAARLMLEHKGIQHETVDLPPGSQALSMRARGFRGPTVPGIKIDGRRVQTTRAISRALDDARPEPPLFPADPEGRAAVEEAERWGDEIYQPIPRRAFRWALTDDRDLRIYLAKEIGDAGSGRLLGGRAAAHVAAGQGRRRRPRDGAGRHRILPREARPRRLADRGGDHRRH